MGNINSCCCAEDSNETLKKYNQYLVMEKRKYVK